MEGLGHSSKKTRMGAPSTGSHRSSKAPEPSDSLLSQASSSSSVATNRAAAKYRLLGPRLTSLLNTSYISSGRSNAKALRISPLARNSSSKARTSVVGKWALKLATCWTTHPPRMAASTKLILLSPSASSVLWDTRSPRQSQPKPRAVLRAHQTVMISLKLGLRHGKWKVHYRKPVKCGLVQLHEQLPRLRC